MYWYTHGHTHTHNLHGRPETFSWNSSSRLPVYTRKRTHLHCFYCRVLTRAATTETCSATNKSLMNTTRASHITQSSCAQLYYTATCIIRPCASNGGTLRFMSCAYDAHRLTRRFPAFPFPGGTCFLGTSLCRHRGECKHPALPTASSQDARDLSRIPMPFCFSSRSKVLIGVRCVPILHQNFFCPSFAVIGRI